ncbi:MAG: hypothetical protein R3E56_14790 [Burkholderiaceae bacterium]
MKTTLSHPPVTLERGQMWPPPGQPPGLWQVEQGMLLVQCPTTRGQAHGARRRAGRCLDLASAASWAAAWRCG